MEKFIVHYVKGKTSLVQIKCELVSAVEDPSVIWAPAGEYRVKVLSPDFLLEKKEDGRLACPVYYGHSLFSSLEEARAQAEKDIRQGFETAIRKHKIESYTEEDVQKKLAEITTVML